VDTWRFLTDAAPKYRRDTAVKIENILKEVLRRGAPKALKGAL
jgi:hypothetical protein